MYTGFVSGHAFRRAAARGFESGFSRWGDVAGPKARPRCVRTPFWQRRYYDFNVWSKKKLDEKMHYIHQNPVRRGLVAQPEDWKWSSFRHIATGEDSVVEIVNRNGPQGNASG